MSKSTSYTATDPETGDVFTRSTERGTGYAFAVIVRDLRDGERTHHWAEWAARRDLAEKNASSWNAKRGTITISGRRTRYGYTGDRTIEYGAGYRAVVVPAVEQAPDRGSRRPVCDLCGQPIISGADHAYNVNREHGPAAQAAADRRFQAELSAAVRATGSGCTGITDIDGHSHYMDGSCDNEMPFEMGGPA